MARPKKSDTPKKVSIYLPEPIYDQLSLILWSPVERRVPHGEWSRFFEQLARQAIERLKQASPTTQPQKG